MWSDREAGDRDAGMRRQWRGREREWRSAWSEAEAGRPSGRRGCERRVVLTVGLPWLQQPQKTAGCHALSALLPLFLLTTLVTFVLRPAILEPNFHLHAHHQKNISK